ncbi:TRM11 family SAM-dependent methyltransferase [Dermacoccaceae bacterium W4C1]
MNPVPNAPVGDAHPNLEAFPTAPAVMRTYLSATYADLVAERVAGCDEDIHFTRSLAQAVLEDLSAPGQRVLDPFAGFGTTLRAAQRCGRSAVGVELLPERCAVATREAPDATVVEGDARELKRLVTGPFDLILTSPPYRTRTDHPQDPLSAYARDGGDYRQYLDELASVFGQCLDLLTAQGHLVVNVANIAAPQGFTPLAWDIGLVLHELGEVVQEVPVCWDRPLHDLTGDTLIVLRRAAAD